MSNPRKPGEWWGDAAIRLARERDEIADYADQLRGALAALVGLDAIQREYGSGSDFYKQSELKAWARASAALAKNPVAHVPGDADRPTPPITRVQDLEAVGGAGPVRCEQCGACPPWAKCGSATCPSLGAATNADVTLLNQAITKADVLLQAMDIGLVDWIDPTGTYFTFSATDLEEDGHTSAKLLALVERFRTPDVSLTEKKS